MPSLHSTRAFAEAERYAREDLGHDTARAIGIKGDPEFRDVYLVLVQTIDHRFALLVRGGDVTDEYDAADYDAN